MEEFIMNVIKNLEGTKLTVSVEGRLDTTTAPELEKQLNDSIESATELILDFTNLEYISSAGLRVLLSAHKAMSKKGEMKICNINESVQEVFEVTGFDDILTIE
jgi:anti-sigma B factor antagonist